MKGITHLVGLGFLFCVAGVSYGQNWTRPPLKVNTTFQFKVEVTTIPQIPRPTAPWYAYFPADPRLVPSMQASPYPPWPMQFPPPAPPFDLQKQGSAPGNAPRMVTQNASSPSLQPVGYVPMQAPSYWYSNR